MPCRQLHAKAPGAILDASSEQRKARALAFLSLVQSLSQALDMLPWGGVKFCKEAAVPKMNG